MANETISAGELKTARDRHGHNKTEAAASVGVTERTWHEWESKGAAPRSGAHRDRLAEYMEWMPEVSSPAKD